jgi:phage shock protein A
MNPLILALIFPDPEKAVPSVVAVVMVAWKVYEEVSKHFRKRKEERQADLDVTVTGARGAITDAQSALDFRNVLITDLRTKIDSLEEELMAKDALLKTRDETSADLQKRLMETNSRVDSLFAALEQVKKTHRRRS